MNAPNRTVRALSTFIVRGAGGLRVRVRVLPSEEDVDRQYGTAQVRRRGKRRVAACESTQSGRGYRGYFCTIALALDGDWLEFVPHEATHAVVRFMQRHGRRIYEEKLATAIGILTARIWAALHRPSAGRAA